MRTWHSTPLERSMALRRSGDPASVVRAGEEHRRRLWAAGAVAAAGERLHRFFVTMTL